MSELQDLLRVLNNIREDLRILTYEVQTLKERVDNVENKVASAEDKTSKAPGGSSAEG